MVLFNYATKEITAKVVYYGPGLCGKTTNLQFIYDSLPSNNKSKMLSLATKTDRTLFFDFLPLDLGKIRGMRTKLQLYTVPGQVYYNSTRQLVLKGADGVVFVADSQDFALDANVESLQNLEDNLRRQGIRINEIPVVMQYNKRDLPNVLPVEELDKEVNRLNVPSFESVATTGLGVEETLKGIAHEVLAHLMKKYGLEGSEEPLEKEQIQVLNAPSTPEEAGQAPAETVWSDEEESPVETKIAAPAGYVIDDDDDDDDDDVPLVSAELVERPPVPEGGFTPDSNPFGEIGPPPDDSSEVPLASVEMKLPDDIRDSLPKVPGSQPAAAPAPSAQAPAKPAPAAEPERRAEIVKEVTIPLNLSMSELKGQRKLKLRITLDVNMLP
jgi:signal recognition particle receptor subunit beta